MKCSRIDCDLSATHQAGLLLYAPKGPWLDEPIKSSGLIFACKIHKETTTVEGLLTDAGWAQIISALDAVGKMRPARSRTKVWFRELPGSPIQPRERWYLFLVNATPPHVAIQAGPIHNDGSPWVFNISWATLLDLCELKSEAEAKAKELASKYGCLFQGELKGKFYISLSVGVAN